MRLALLAVAAAVCLARATDPEEDDEVVIVEDVTELAEARVREQKKEEKPKQHKKYRESAYEKRKKREAEAKQLTPAECFEKARVHLEDLKAIADKFQDYGDGEMVADLGEDLETGPMELFRYHYETVKKEHKLNAGPTQELYEEAEAIAALKAELREVVEAQVEAHQFLLQSARNIIPQTEAYNPLAAYVKQRLKAGGKKLKRVLEKKDLSKKLASKKNISELLKLQAHMRHKRWLGLSKDESNQLFIFAVAPWLLQAVVRVVLAATMKMPNFVPMPVDCVLAFVVPAGAAYLTVSAVGFMFLSPKNVAVITCLTLSLWSLYTMLIETALRPLIAKYSATKRRRFAKRTAGAKEAGHATPEHEGSSDGEKND
eukprot:TRINITY_DN22170_c0_g1_i1.p1 TRINITY_DN22170_c0_g1~~TRINITY_DN22170_c0_g1_i1.p1  ORF type:complete len:373 (+),score=173.81 TRINITY_DN22170_c0_g1_i1:54-1172(+)